MSQVPPEQRFGEKGTKQLLPKAETILKETLLANKMELIRFETKIKDRYGTYATPGIVKTPLGYWHFILLAREYLMGQFVGCDRSIMQRCLQEGRKLLIYVEHENTILVFDATEVYESEGLQLSQRNGTQSYYDFKHNLGKKLPVWIAGYMKKVSDAQQSRILEFTEEKK
jgi:hypothetical protein